MLMRKILFSISLALAAAVALPTLAHADGEAKNVIFFLGDGMGPTTVTAARIYKYGEDGQLHMESLPRTARVKTYSNDAQTTDSAPSMSAYMTGTKMNNEVIAMTPNTVAVKPQNNNTTNMCVAGGPNGAPVATLLEAAKYHGKAIGAVTTTRVTHATPASTYAHICHRDLENDIAAQVVPGGEGYNGFLADGLDVLFGGGRRQFLPTTVTGGLRTDGRDLTAELAAHGYTYVSNKTGLQAIPASATRAVGLFTMSHMSYELDRDPAVEPSLTEMAMKAIDILSQNPNGYFLVVEGGRIDHALHETNAIRALNDAIAFDDAIAAVLGRVDLSNTLIVVTADHDHTMVINGYAKRTGATSATNPGILGFVRDAFTGDLVKDLEGLPYTILGFGNGEHRVSGARTVEDMALSESATSAIGYHQEAGVKMTVGGETHGGGDVMLMAGGAGSAAFKGTLDNTRVYTLIKKAVGF
jgi:alkaline phosphatase